MYAFCVNLLNLKPRLSPISVSSRKERDNLGWNSLLRSRFFLSRGWGMSHNSPLTLRDIANKGCKGVLVSKLLRGAVYDLERAHKNNSCLPFQR